MLKPIDRGSTLIAAQPLTFSGRRYRPGDKFDYSRMGIQHRRTVERLLKTRKLTELTAETMKTALRFREENAGPPRGFTLSGLKAFGYLTDDQIVARGWAKRDQEVEVTDDNADQTWTPPEGAWKVYAEGSDEEKATADTTLWIVPFRNGNRGAYRYFVHDLDGTNLSGDASISGKDNAETWARNFMKERAEKAAADRKGEPDWSAFPENPDDWSDEQVEIFDAWYDGLQPGLEVKVEHAAVQKLYEERVEAARQDADAGTSDDNAPQQEGAGILAGLTSTEANELLEAMTDDELRAHVATVTGKDPELLKELAPLALREMAIAAQLPNEGIQNGGDVQPGPDDAAG